MPNLSQPFVTIPEEAVGVLELRLEEVDLLGARVELLELLLHARVELLAVAVVLAAEVGVLATSVVEAGHRLDRIKRMLSCETLWEVGFPNYLVHPIRKESSTPSWSPLRRPPFQFPNPLSFALFVGFR